MSDIILLLLFGVLSALLIISYAPIFHRSTQNDQNSAHFVESASAKTVNLAAHNSRHARPTDVEPAGYNMMVNIWEDVNGDGRRDSNEPSLSNIEINVVMDGRNCVTAAGFAQCVGVPPVGMLTDEDGQAIFAGLAPPPSATGTSRIWVELSAISDQYLVTYSSDGSNEATHLLPWPAMPSGIYNAASSAYVPKRITWGLQRK